jgi:hypothetical protein
MKKRKVAIVGASVGGVVAAAELNARGFDVTILEKGAAVGGMYSKIDTPFGPQELGMHVLYLAEAHYCHLTAIFGLDAFQTWTGTSVDIGSSYNFGRGHFDSVYPDIRMMPDVHLMLDELLNIRSTDGREPCNAFEAAVSRFGKRVTEKVYAPILEKLWKVGAETLSPGALHCFFDLRRVVICDKDEADRLKQNPRLDGVIANPIQTMPAGPVYEGRLAARFKKTNEDQSRKAKEWLTRSGIAVHFNQSVEVDRALMMLNGTPMDETFDACIVATPLASLVPTVAKQMQMLELSIYYFKLAVTTGVDFPAYYMACHAPELASSRIVNYGAYAHDAESTQGPIVAVEVAHVSGQAPEIDVIAAELVLMLPTIKIEESFKLPHSLKVPLPTVSNARLLDNSARGAEMAFSERALFFAGMRTDKGVFFSHHTIGLAYDAAVECMARFA